MAGVSLVLLVCALVLLSSLFLWGAVVGAVLFLLITIKQYFFPSKNTNSVNHQFYNQFRQSQDEQVGQDPEQEDSSKPSGRVIDCDDFEEKK